MNCVPIFNLTADQQLQILKKKYLTYLPNTVVPHLFLLLYFFALSSPLLPVVMNKLNRLNQN